MKKDKFIYVIVLLLGLAISIDMLMKKDKTGGTDNTELIAKEREKALLMELGEVYAEVDEMPRFVGCEDMEGTMTEKTECAEKKMLEYIYESIEYPEEARRKNIEGLVMLKFIIDKKGKIRGAKILEDIGSGCGEEALRVINSMNDLEQGWIPGKKNGKIVNVKYQLPVRYQLDYY